MNKCAMFICIPLATVVLGFASEAKAQGCSSPPKKITQADHREYRGVYRNEAYGYSVVIPPRLVGYDDGNPFYQHGFGLLLSGEPQSYIFVNGEPNTLEFTRPADAASQLVGYIGKDGKVDSSKITESHLGALRAAFLVATYTCPGSGEGYTTASLVAISHDKSKLYEVTIFGRSGRFAADRAIFDALAKSWKYLGPKANSSL